MTSDPMAASNAAAQTRVTAAREKQSKTVRWGVILVMTIVALLVLPRMFFGGGNQTTSTGGESVWNAPPPAPAAVAEPGNVEAGSWSMPIRPGAYSPEVKYSDRMRVCCDRPDGVSVEIYSAGKWVTWKPNTYSGRSHRFSNDTATTQDVLVARYDATRTNCPL